MVFLGLEKPVEYGAQQIFDPTMANMVLQTQQQYNEAARREYERGLKDFDTFLTKYGDFISPFAKDMARYGEMVGGIQNTINKAYADGVDLLRSPEGRMIVRQLANSIDPAEFNTMRANAKVGFEYLDAIEKAKVKNQFNQEFEDYSLMNGGPGLFNEFSSAGGKMWNRPAPYVYEDLNQYTGHIFDKMDDSYLGTGPDHYDYYGVSREDRQKALTQHLSGLLSTPLGQFHYQKSKANWEAVHGREATPEEAMKAYQDDILTSTTEYEHRNRKLNEMWKLQQENATRLNAARISHPGSNNPQQSDQWSFAEMVRRNSATSIMGQQVQEYSDKTLAGIRDAQIKFGLQVSKNTGGHSFKSAGQMAFKEQYGQNKYRASDIATFLGFKVTDEDTSTMQLPKSQFNRLHSLYDVTSHTTGFRGKMVSTNNDWLNNADVVTITPTQGSYGAYNKDATFKNHFEMQVVAYKKVPLKDANDAEVKDSNGVVQYTYKPVGTKIQYIDSHITSIKNDPRSGYLGTLGKDGKVTPTPGISVTNTQDSRYQDAIVGDKNVTKDIIANTIYQPDAILSELPGYAKQLP